MTSVQCLLPLTRKELLQRLLDADAACCSAYGANLGADKVRAHAPLPAMLSVMLSVMLCSVTLRSQCILVRSSDTAARTRLGCASQPPSWPGCPRTSLRSGWRKRCSRGRR